MHKFLTVAATAAAAMALSACGGSSFTGSSASSSGGTSSGGTSSGGSTTTTYSMGNGSGSAFQTGTIKIANATVAAGGTDDLEVSVVDNTGALYTAAPVSVTFSSSCIAQGLATITPSGTSTAGTNAATVATTTGTVFATYTAKGCSGADVITASAAVASTNLTATGTLTAQSGTIGSVQFVSATPANIGLKGTGIAETSTVVFQVVDSSGSPRPGATVNFTLPTNVGGVTLAPPSATSGADGKVQTVVSSGTQHVSVKVTATITDPALSTQSGVLTVTTGLPVSDTFSISVGPADYGTAGKGPACPNIEAANINQIRVPITVSLADRFKNPAPNGTAVALTTNAGKILGACVVTNTGNSDTDGECQVTWSSEDPRPTPQDTPPSAVKNRGVILASATGEESFTDANGDGFYETGEVFKDLGEPYLDANENGTYELNEYFVDFNNNHVHDGPDGVFKGVTCTANACSSTPWAISTSIPIIMSTSGVQVTGSVSGTGVTVVSGVYNIPHGTAFAVNFNLQDLSGTINSTTHLFQNGNPIPAGSAVAVTSSGASITLTGTTSFTQGCSTSINGDTYGVAGTAGTTTGAGSITIAVTSPGTKTISSTTIPINIT